jgi:hypothetical protein
MLKPFMRFAGCMQGSSDLSQRKGFASYAVRQLTGSELSCLAEKMAQSSNPEEAAQLRETIMRGFYGQQSIDP